jgi:hypothetical protein
MGSITFSEEKRTLKRAIHNGGLPPKTIRFKAAKFAPKQVAKRKI